MRFRWHLICGVVFMNAMAASFPARGGLSFDGSSQHVTFGTAGSLGSPVFTVETWFDWSGGGVAANTGGGGVMAIPLVAKLHSEADGDNRDGNYFLGIRPGDGVLVADLEEGAAGSKPGLNHPVAGVTAIRSNTWHHAAVTYNGTNFLLFLDGHLETTLFVGQPPRSDSIQHAAFASSLNSTGTPQGYFSGILDDVRIWNYARSASQIASNRTEQISSAAGLLGRWSLAETNGLIAHDSSGHGMHGTLVNGPRWVSEHRASADVITPLKLSAIDPERTAILREAQSKQVPPVFRFDPGIAEQVERSFRASFQGANKGFPAGRDLVRTWANGRSDNLVQADLAAKLREVMARYICSDLLPREAKLGPATVRLYALAFGNATPDLDAIQTQSLSCSRTNLWAIEKARRDLRQPFPASEEGLANYLAGFVKENCIFDAELTGRSRARHAEAFFAADHYEPGQVIVRKGQIIDARTRAALEELKTQMAVEERKARAATEQIQAENALTELRQRAALSEFKSQLFSQQNRWLLGGLVLVAVSSSIAFWQMARSKRGGRNLLPVPVYPRDDGLSADASFGSATDGSDVSAWKERALGAEKRAAQTSAVLRTNVFPHLVEWLKSKLVRGLLTQRAHLLSTQQKAEQDLADLEARLAKVHAPLEERLQLYRQRIDDLQRELLAKGQENRELIRAKIELTRKRLEAEDRTIRGTDSLSER